MYKRILIVVDDDDVARAALAEGLDMAKSQRASVLFYHVLPTDILTMSEPAAIIYLSMDEYRKAMEERAARILGVAMAEAKRLGVMATTMTGISEDAAQSISQAALDNHCNMIVIGSHGRSALQRLVMGSVVTRLITLSSVPMLVCKPGVNRKEVTEKLPVKRHARRRHTAQSARSPAMSR